MMDDHEEDALFDRLAKSLEAVRQDAELVRSRGADAMTTRLARAESELRTLAVAVDALCQRVAQQQAVTEQLEAAAAKSDAEIQELTKTVDQLSRNLKQQT